MTFYMLFIYVITCLLFGPNEKKTCVHIAKGVLKCHFNIVSNRINCFLTISSSLSYKKMMTLNKHDVNL